MIRCFCDGRLIASAGFSCPALHFQDHANSVELSTKLPLSTGGHWSPMTKKDCVWSQHFLQTGSFDVLIHLRHLSVLPTVVFHQCCRHDIQTTAAVFYLTLSGCSARLSLCNRQPGVSGYWCHRLERPASPRRICAVTRGFQTTTQDLSVFPFLPRHYHMTRMLLLPCIRNVWTPVVLAITNII